MTNHPAKTFRAFISYSHAADGKLAPVVQEALQAFAKPWYALRSCRIFRDQSTLSITAELWTSIERALIDSEYLILFASPAAAASDWVRREVAWWCENRAINNLLILLTDGDIVWDEPTGDLDWSKTTALPRCLSGKFSAQPLYLDMRWAKNNDRLSPQDSQLYEAIVDISCSLWGLSKDDLIGKDVREHRRTKRITQGAVVILSMLLVATLAQTIRVSRALQLAEDRRIQAENARALAEERRVQARAVAETIVFELQDRLQVVPEAAAARKVLNEKAHTLLISLGTPEGDFRVKRALMAQHSQQADEAIAKGDNKLARQELLESLKLANELSAQDAMNANFRRDVSVALNKVGNFLMDIGEYDAAKEYFEKDLELSNELLSRQPGSLKYRNDLALSYEKMGKVLMAKGDLEQSLSFIEKDVDLMLELHKEYPTNLSILRDLAVARVEQGEVLLQAKKPTDASKALKEALQLYEKYSGERPDDARAEYDRSVVWLKMGDIEVRGEAYANAVSNFEKALAIRLNLAKRNPGDMPTQQGLSVAYGRIGSIQLQQAQWGPGVQSMEEAIRIQTELLARNPQDGVLQYELGLNLYELTMGLVELKKLDYARRRIAESTKFLRSASQLAPQLHERNLALFRSLRANGSGELRFKDGAEAARLHHEACNIVHRIPLDAVSNRQNVEIILDLRDIATGHLDSNVGTLDVVDEALKEAIQRTDSLAKPNDSPRQKEDISRLRKELEELTQESARKRTIK